MEQYGICIPVNVSKSEEELYWLAYYAQLNAEEEDYLRGIHEDQIEEKKHVRYKNAQNH